MDSRTVERQTLEIVRCLLGDEEGDSQGRLETDGPGDDSFDPTDIADKLKKVAAGLQRDAEFQAALVLFKKATKEQTQEEIITAFSQAVDNVCGTQGPGLAMEMQSMQVAVALCLYLRQKAPELNAHIQQATANFLNRRVGGFVATKGGWGSVV